jgi:hypothetical protein
MRMPRGRESATGHTPPVKAERARRPSVRTGLGYALAEAVAA